MTIIPLLTGEKEKEKGCLKGKRKAKVAAFLLLVCRDNCIRSSLVSLNFSFFSLVVGQVTVIVTAVGLHGCVWPWQQVSTDETHPRLPETGRA